MGRYPIWAVMQPPKPPKQQARCHGCGRFVCMDERVCAKCEREGK